MLHYESQSPPPLLIDLALIFIERPTISQDLARSGCGVMSGLGSDEVDTGSIDKSFRRQHAGDDPPPTVATGGQPRRSYPYQLCRASLPGRRAVHSVVTLSELLGLLRRARCAVI